MTDRNLTAEDLRILDTYKTLAEGLAAYLGSSYEIALHSLADWSHSVIKIINGFHTGRTEGSPITDLGISMLKRLESDNSSSDFQVYFCKNKQGEPMKSTTIAIRGKGRRIIGLLCINLYLNTPMVQHLSELLPRDASVFTAENFAENSTNAVEQKLQEAKNKVLNDQSILPSMRNKEIIRLLYSLHVFELKNSVELVAKELGISVSTVYFHLRNICTPPGTL